MTMTGGEGKGYGGEDETRARSGRKRCLGLPVSWLSVLCTNSSSCV